MNNSLCHIRFKTHSAHISVEEDGLIHVFKYTDSRCDLESFYDQDEAADYIWEKLPDLVYEVVLPEPNSN